MADLKVLNPVARTERPKIPSAPRPEDLSGKTVGLYWNGKYGGDTLLAQSSDLLRQKYDGIQFRNYGPKDLGAGSQYDELAKTCHAVIQASGD
ncbi:MAG: hypothetical protein EXR28_14670 [Betaproteobacteria bacterium]|nr:hypothetical protein [Betaproteobacteria bacterium]